MKFEGENLTYFKLCPLSKISFSRNLVCLQKKKNVSTCEKKVMEFKGKNLTFNLYLFTNKISSSVGSFPFYPSSNSNRPQNSPLTTKLPSLAGNFSVFGNPSMKKMQ